MKMSFFSILHQFLHYIRYYYTKPLMHFNQGSLIISIDVDVGSPELGIKNDFKNDTNIHNYLPEKMIGKIEEQVVPLLINTFNELDVPVTLAIRGQLTEIDDSIIPLILNSPIQHDIGAHGYFHKCFTTLSITEANNELELISIGMKKFGLHPKSFVFPKNQIAHLSLLENWGYSCFRGCGNILRNGMYVKKIGNLYDVHPGYYLGSFQQSIFLKKIIDLSIMYKVPFHIWFHPWNFGYTLQDANNSIKYILHPILNYAKEKHKEGDLTFETMHSITEKVISMNIHSNDNVYNISAQ